jgi:DNA-binding NtrC family response regulator
VKTILVVENDANQRRLYQMELEEEGYCVVLASDGREALRQIREYPPDLVILDLLMPGLDGVETLDWMTEMRLDLPVIIYSAYGGLGRYMSRAVDAYLVKSSNLDPLKAEIRRALMRREKEGIPAKTWA